MSCLIRHVGPSRSAHQCPFVCVQRPFDTHAGPSYKTCLSFAPHGLCYSVRRLWRKCERQQMPHHIQLSKRRVFSHFPEQRTRKCQGYSLPTTLHAKRLCRTPCSTVGFKIDASGRAAADIASLARSTATTHGIGQILSVLTDIVAPQWGHLIWSGPTHSTSCGFREAPHL